MQERPLNGHFYVLHVHVVLGLHSVSCHTHCSYKAPILSPFASLCHFNNIQLEKNCIALRRIRTCKIIQIGSTYILFTLYNVNLSATAISIQSRSAQSTSGGSFDHDQM